MEQARILFQSENVGSVEIWARGSTRNSAIMELVRRIHFTAAENLFAVKVTHISGHDNGIADSLSRFQHQRFRQLVPEAERHGHTTRSDVPLTATPGNTKRSSSLERIADRLVQEGVALATRRFRDHGLSRFQSFCRTLNVEFAGNLTIRQIVCCITV